MQNKNYKRIWNSHLRVVWDEFTQFRPQLVFGLAVLGCEGVCVDAPLVLLGRSLQQSNGDEVTDAVLGILWTQLNESVRNELMVIITTDTVAVLISNSVYL